MGTKLPWPRLKDVAVPLLAVDEQPAGARATRKRSIPGESTARTLVIVVAVPEVGGSARLGASPPKRLEETREAGSTTLLVSAELRPQVLQAVTEEVLDPPATNANAPSGENDTSRGGRGERNLFQRILCRPHIQIRAGRDESLQIVRRKVRRGRARNGKRRAGTAGGVEHDDLGRGRRSAASRDRHRIGIGAGKNHFLPVGRNGQHFSGHGLELRHRGRSGDGRSASAPGFRKMKNPCPCRPSCPGDRRPESSASPAIPPPCPRCCSAKLMGTSRLVHPVVVAQLPAESGKPGARYVDRGRGRGSRGGGGQERRPHRRRPRDRSAAAASIRYCRSAECRKRPRLRRRPAESSTRSAGSPPPWPDWTNSRSKARR